MSIPALFLDRDGVINVNHGYVHKTENFDFIDGIFDVVKRANEAGYLVIVVTNQAGIGRGYYTEEDFEALMDWVRGRFSAHGACIDAVYYSPYHPEHGIGKYKKDSDCRKPRPGMILKAAKELNVDLKKSILIGDKETDMKAGRAAGIPQNILFEYGKSKLSDLINFKAEDKI